jgi:hypothetical protein
MRSLKRIFNRLRGENLYWSDYTYFAEAVRGKGFSRKTIICNFDPLVNEKEKIMMKR